MAERRPSAGSSALNQVDKNYKYGGDSAIGALLLPERREILQEEQNQFIGYDDRGQAIVQTLPAQYGESEVDFSYSPIVRGAKATGSFLNDIFFGDANEQSEAAGRAVSAVRGVVGGLRDYASSQYEAGMAGGTIYDPETRQITEFDPALVMGGGSSGGGPALASGFRRSGSKISNQTVSSQGQIGKRIKSIQDERARLKRAQDLGFDTDNPIYHSTNASFDSFELPEDRFLKYGQGVYASPSPEYADRYIREGRKLESGYKEGANVVPMYARGKIGTEQDWETARQEMLAEGISPTGYGPMQEEIKRRLQDKGFDGLNMFGDEIIIYDPKNLRSINADFNPAMSDSDMLLYSGGGRQGSAIAGGSALHNLKMRAVNGDESAIAELVTIEGLDKDNVVRRLQNYVARYGGQSPEQRAVEYNASKPVRLGQSTEERKVVSSSDYRGDHQPPDREYGAPLNDLTSMIPEDIYSPAGVRLYGFGNTAVDTEAFEALRAARGNPRAEVSIYRAVPQDVNNINAGDWVTTSRAYADMHGESALGGNYQVLEQKARAGDLHSEGYPYEFGFNPLDMSQSARMQRAQDLGFDTRRTAYRGLGGEYDPSKAGNYQMFTSSPEDASEYGSNVVSSYLRKGNNLVVDGGRNNFNSIPVDQLPDDVKANLHSSVGSVARTDDIAYAAQAAGYDSVSINNVFDKASNEIPLRPSASNNEPLSQEMMDFLDEVNASGMLDSVPNVDLSTEIPRNYDPTTIDIIFDPKNIRSIEAEFDPTKADSADLLSSRQSERQMSALRGIA